MDLGKAISNPHQKISVTNPGGEGFSMKRMFDQRL